MIEEKMVSEMLDRESIVEGIERRLGRDKAYRPVITISREPGSGGRPIGKMLAKKLGFKFYDKTLIARVGEKMGLATEILTQVDERSRSGLVDMVQNMFNPDYVSDDAYFRNLCQVIYKLAQRGGSVVVGRGANFIIPQAQCLRVQIVSPYRVRVARAVQYEHFSREEAREVIRRVTADRVNYVKQYFGKNIVAPKYYDLTINTTFFTLEQAVDMVIKAYKFKFTQSA